MKRFTLALVVLVLACSSPGDPVEFNQFAAGDTFPQMSNLPLGGDGWPPPGHFCNNPVVCFICYQSIGERDHDGDGFYDRTEYQYPDDNPQPPPLPENPFGPFPGGGEWMW